MLTFAILLILIYSFYTGYRRGFVIQFVRLVGYIISTIVASKLYIPFSKYTEVFVPFPSIQPNSQLAIYNEATSFILDTAFYRVVSFMVVAFVGWLITNFIGVFFKRVSYYMPFRWVNHLAGGVMNVLTSFVFVYLILFVMSLIPVEAIQQQFVDNPIAYRIVSQTPILTDMAMKTWLQVNPFR